MGINIGDGVVRILGDTTPVDRKIAGIGDKAKRAGTQATRGLKPMNVLLKTIGKLAAAVGVTFLAWKAVSIFRNMIKAAQKTQKVREVTKILRTQFPELTAAEAKDGAVTAIAWVVSRASWISYMQRGCVRKGIVSCPDACEICRGNDEQGPIPIDEAFKSGQQHPPFHGSCRCALVPSR